MLRVFLVILCFCLGAVGTRADQPSREESASQGWKQSDLRMVRALLANAADEGLDPDRYRVSPSGDRAHDQAVFASALLSYMRDLAIGRSDLMGVDADIALPPRALDSRAILEGALQVGNLSQTVAGLAPAHPAYLALRSALATEADPRRRDILAANMERWRWLPAQLEPDRIEVNAATAELTMWLGGRQILSSRVIVGKPVTRTPILRAEGAGITVNPAWNVPHSIAVKEILPKLKRNSAWLKSQDMVLLNGPSGDPHGLTVNWQGIPAGTFPYRIRQAPGATNPLGQVKLELPNRFDVYLHDTPGRASFNRSNRAQSHGCIRVEQIMPLASYALAAGPESMALIQNAIGRGKTSYLPLARKVPVYVLYWTAFPGKEGTIQFVPDLYGRDARMITAMQRRSSQVAAVESGCRKT